MASYELASLCETRENQVLKTALCCLSNCTAISRRRKTFAACDQAVIAKISCDLQSKRLLIGMRPPAPGSVSEGESRIKVAVGDTTLRASNVLQNVSPVPGRSDISLIV